MVEVLQCIYCKRNGLSVIVLCSAQLKTILSRLQSHIEQLISKFETMGSVELKEVLVYRSPNFKVDIARFAQLGIMAQY